MRSRAAEESRAVVGSTIAMMTREEFERTVRAMKAEGLTLSMPNLMLRTELPRHVIEDWLEEMDDRAKNPAPPARAAKGRAAKGDNAQGDRTNDVADDLMKKVNELKDEFVKSAAKAAVKEKLGLDDDDAPRVHGAPKSVKDLRVGAGLGLVLGPFGFFYSAPYPVAIMASVAYAAAAVGLNFIPVIGSVIFAYVVPLVHLSSAVAGAGYTWRYNRSGRRAALLPKNEK
jgi:hypothetical protein